MANKIAVANIKGGVAKTTTAVTLACELSKRGKTLLCDLDPQGSASSFLGVRDGDYSITHVLNGIIPFEKAIQQMTSEDGSVLYENLHILPADLSLLSLAEKLEASKSLEDLKEEIRGVENFSNEELMNRINALQKKSYEALFVLKDIISKIEKGYEYIVFDCSPYDNILVTNVFVAAEHVIVPLKLDKSSMEGYSFLVDKLKRIRMNYNKEINVLGILPTMYKKTILHDDTLKALREMEELNGLLFKTYIRSSIRVEESPYEEVPVTMYEPKNASSEDYMNFVEEVVERLK